MPINSLKFLKIFLDIFIKRYQNLPIDIIADIIVTVLIDAPERYFTYDMVQKHPEFCRKCGACCKQRNEPCPYFNGRTCDDYYSRFDVCAEFPYYDIDGDEGLMLDPGCQFALKLAEMQIDKDLQREVDFLLEE